MLTCDVFTRDITQVHKHPLATMDPGTSRCKLGPADKPREVRVKLISIKRGIYNPYLRTFRKYEMDNTLGKLADEHCRTSIPIDKEMPTNPFYQYDPPSSYIGGYDEMGFLKERQWKEDPYSKSLAFLSEPHLPPFWARLKRSVPLGEGSIINIPTVR
ncbi:hypothetical protein AAG570_004295 [Ranatra chinensis]|uniref:Uncharacterized protein n=1 Tax=Ranatra chinensis TaxID=642074 RepID=A0ABD0Y1A6_9HEMI